MAGVEKVAGGLDGGFKMGASSFKMMTRGLKKGAESVKGGVVYALEVGNEKPDRHDRAESPRDADWVTPNEAPRTGRGGDLHEREAVAALHERGEKLETLKSKVDGLAVESEAFAANAHRLNQGQRGR